MPRAHAGRCVSDMTSVGLRCRAVSPSTTHQYAAAARCVVARQVAAAAGIPASTGARAPAPCRAGRYTGTHTHTHTHLPLFVHATQRPDATTLKSIHNAQSALTAAAVRRT